MSGQTDRRYRQAECEEYVSYLGLWNYPSPASQLHHRSEVEYRRLLERLIEVNKGRLDEVGVWESAAARRELRGMSG